MTEFPLQRLFVTALLVCGPIVLFTAMGIQPEDLGGPQSLVGSVSKVFMFVGPAIFIVYAGAIGWAYMQGGYGSPSSWDKEQLAYAKFEAAAAKVEEACGYPRIDTGVGNYRTSRYANPNLGNPGPVAGHRLGSFALTPADMYLSPIAQASMLDYITDSYYADSGSDSDCDGGTND